MITTLIPAFPKVKRDHLKDDPEVLHVAEFFMNTIQGEGINIGHPAAFLRLQHCTLNCGWCDTTEVWQQGNPYTIDELFEIMKDNLVEKLENGHHLVLTGGSPLRQQKMLIEFLSAFEVEFGFFPYVEIENECTIMPDSTLIDYISCWNNSPKLSGSGNPKVLRYKPDILRRLSDLPNSWFKFVVYNKNHMHEIIQEFVNPGLINMDQIILMPLGADRGELNETRKLTVALAVENGVRYCTREHIVLWNRKTGV